MDIKRKIIILLGLLGIVAIVLLISGETEINISDSYRSQEQLSGEYIESTKTLSIDLGNRLGFDCLVIIDHTNEKIKLNNISIQQVKSRIGENAAINVSTMLVPYDDNIQALQLNFNLSSSNLFGNEVGSCLVKITPQGTLLVSSKTDNVKVNF